MIHICIAADENYSAPLRALKNSIARNAGCKYEVHVLSDLQVPDFPAIKMQYWSKAIFYRIMLPEIFPQLDRVLYLDCDTLVLKNISELCEMPLPDWACVAMVPDNNLVFSRANLKILGLDMYFNSGVILMDLEKCRRFDFTEKCMRFLKNNAGKVIYPDQDAINMVLSGKILRLPLSFNSQVNMKCASILGLKCHIVHFIGKDKPWNSEHLYSEFYNEYIR